MIKAMKIRLIPTYEQEILMKKSVGIARFAYNWGLNKWKEMYKEGLKPNKEKVKKEFNNTIKKQKDYEWLYEVSAQVTTQAFWDLGEAYNNFFKHNKNFPKFKSKKNSRESFYVRYDAIRFHEGRVNMEKIGMVKYRTNYKLPKLKKFIDPRCHFDGKYWYLTLAFEQDESQVELNKNLSIGIDLGISNLAIVSHIDKPIENINKSVKVKKIKKKLKRLQRKASKKYVMNKKGKEFIKTNNILKLERQIKLINRDLTNIRNNHIHQATSRIIKLRPNRVVMENLNIKGLMKNRHLSQAIQEQKLYEFIRQIEYKCQFNGIEFIKADRFFPSSKTCSNCGNINDDLKLSDRVYKCGCGLTICRDKNASINLSNYNHYEVVN